MDFVYVGGRYTNPKWNIMSRCSDEYHPHIGTLQYGRNGKPLFTITENRSGFSLAELKEIVRQMEFLEK